MVGFGEPKATTRVTAFDRADGARALARLRRRDPEVAAVVALVAGTEHVDPEDILRRNRCCAKIAASRQLAMYLANTILSRSFTEVGERFGRDRTTVAHACRLVEDRRETAAFEQYADELGEIIKAASEPEEHDARVGHVG